MAESTEKKINTKVKLIEYATRNIDQTLSSKNERELNNKLKLIQKSLDDIDELKYVKVEEMISTDSSAEDLDNWSSKIESQIAPYDKVISDLKQALTEVHEIDNPKPPPSSKREESTKKGEVVVTTTPSVKLPKLQIARFDGSHIDWFRFWNQYDAEIDSAKISPVTKFSYLRDMLPTQALALVNGLPFTPEGYERAKTILKTRYGKSSEVVTAHVQRIIGLPIINGANANRIHEFHGTLTNSVQSLETMGKLSDIQGYVRMTLDKLPGIRSDLVRLDCDWQNWKFHHLIEALRSWTDRNPVPDKIQGHVSMSDSSKLQRENLLRTKNILVVECVYCGNTNHKSTECNKITSVEERKRTLADKKLCFNCTRPYHQARGCRSNSKCRNCRRAHHTSICSMNNSHTTKERENDTTQTMMTSEQSQVIYPVVVIYVDGIKCRALLDTGAGSSYASSYLLNLLNKKPTRTERKTIEMMMSSKTTKLEVYKVKIENLKYNFTLQTELNKVDRKVLVKIPNPYYKQLKLEHPHLVGVDMDDTDEKPELPIHVILGASEYARIKTVSKPKIGHQGDPVAELTRFGWTIIRPGKETNVTGTMFANATPLAYDRLCSLDVLGLEELDGQREVFEEFKSQLKRQPNGCYETGLIWKIGHPPLPNNKRGSIGRLKNLVRKLENDPATMEAYNNVIKNQLEEGIIEKAPEICVNASNEYYIPHKPVIREKAESTKLRVVYDASASNNGISLNSCLETGPPLQNLLWSVITRNRTQPISVCADMKQAFLQIRINLQDRDALRFHWINECDTSQIDTYRFTRALFGMNQSPFLLQGTIEQHLDNMKVEYDESIIEKIRKELYVDDVVSGEQTVEASQELKRILIEIFQKAKFTLHKWHSNMKEIENEANKCDDTNTYAKQQLNCETAESRSLTSILGLKWDKEIDTLSITFPPRDADATKRGILRKLASIYDPLGVAGPITLLGKRMFREACDLKLAWDQPLPVELHKRWINWEKNLPTEISIPRAFEMSKTRITYVDIHTFADASNKGVCATVYLVLVQDNGEKHQGILSAKCRLAKKNATIPRLELIAAHMASNLTSNTVECLSSLPIRNINCWTDSTVVLYWLKGSGDYKAFVSNRVAKILKNDYITWRHVPTQENPADAGSRGRELHKLDINWFNGPEWLLSEKDWPENIISTTATNESEVEAKKVKTVLATVVQLGTNETLQLLQKYSLWKFLRITSWIVRFANNCRQQEKRRGPLITDEIEYQRQLWVRTTQQQYQRDADYESEREKLNLQQDANGILVCLGRIAGEYPIYLPRESIICKKIIMDAHLRTLHGGVAQIMSKVRETYWVTKLRSVTKKVLKECNGCKRFHAVAFPVPPPGKLPSERSTVTTKPFKIIGVDYAGPFLIKNEEKVHILLFACSVSRAIHLELLPNQTQEEFIKALKRLVARRGLPAIIYSDNAKTFQSSAKWLNRVLQSTPFHDFNARQGVKWRFNLSRAPWWGGQYERLIGLVKQSLYKSVGRSSLTFKTFEDVLLDVETTLNNRPLCYMEEDVQDRILTPNTLLHGETITLLEDEEVTDEDTQQKRFRYIRRCKDEAWKRWEGEYMRSLRERHNFKHQTKTMAPRLGDVVMIKGDGKNRGKWNIGVVIDLMPGKDGVLRAVRVKSGKYHLERAVQHLYPLELNCDITDHAENHDYDQSTMNPRAEVFERRPTRNAAAISRLLTNDVLETEFQEPPVEL